MQISLNVTFDSDHSSADPTAPAMQNCAFFSSNKILYQQNLVFSVLSLRVLQSFHIEVEILILHILGEGSGGESVCKYLPHKHEDQSLNPQRLGKKLGTES